MDPRVGKHVIDAIEKLQKLFDEKAIIKSNLYNQQPTQEQSLRLIAIRDSLYENLDILRDAAG